jgi:predicted nucleic acid-binding Zn ribbon protein
MLLLLLIRYGGRMRLAAMALMLLGTQWYITESRALGCQLAQPNP